MELTFEDALRIARGCTDYGGGHRSNPEHYEIYQHGIQTVINALTAASKTGLEDMQTRALHVMGANAGNTATDGHCTLGEDLCNCGGDVPAVRADCSNWKRHNANVTGLAPGKDDNLHRKTDRRSGTTGGAESGGYRESMKK